MPRKLPPDRELLALVATCPRREIAKRYGVKLCTVHSTIHAARRRQEHPETINRKLPHDEELIELSKTMTYAEIAERYGARSDYTSRAVRNACIDAGIELPEPNRKLPKSSKLLELSTTHTNSEIAVMYGVKSKSVSAAISRARRASGLAPRRRRTDHTRRLPPDGELLKMSQTMTHREIASQLNASISYVSRHIAAARSQRGLAAARPGRPTRSPDDPRASYDGPPREELDDALTRWGIDGVAEEYDVSTEHVCAWMRALEI